MRIHHESSIVIKLAAEAAHGQPYENHVVARVNDHVVRISTMEVAYPWHLHPDSDEVCHVLEGGLVLELEDRVVELMPGEMFLVNQGVPHRTRPMGARSVNLTFERAESSTVVLETESGTSAAPTA